MHQIFSPAVLASHQLHCPKCNWQGKGDDTEQEELFLTDAIELYCPDCTHYLGFVDAAEETKSQPN